MSWEETRIHVCVPRQEGDKIRYQGDAKVLGGISARGNMYIYENVNVGEYKAYWEHFHESKIRERFWRPSSGQTVIDVGACFGSYTLSALADGAHVISFEPEEEIVKSLGRSILLNGWGEKVLLFQQRLGRLDDITFERKIDIIKIDVEGDELEVAKGAHELIKKDKPTVLIEMHMSKDQDIQQKILDLLKPTRYTKCTDAYTPDTIWTVSDFIE